MKNRLWIVAALVAVAQLTMLSGLSVSSSRADARTRSAHATDVGRLFPVAASTFAAGYAASVE